MQVSLPKYSFLHILALPNTLYTISKLFLILTLMQNKELLGNYILLTSEFKENLVQKPYILFRFSYQAVAKKIISLCFVSQRQL